MAEVKRIEAEAGSWGDDRGWEMNPLEAAALLSKALGNLHVVSIKPGCVRGNHYHPNGTEWMLIFGGTARVAWRSNEEGTIQQIKIEEDDGPAFFEVPPNIRHAIMNTSESDIYLVAINDSRDRGTISCPSLFDAIDERR
jgi:UDP-2-acetamido-2,6-beta-L-arabino-hexul-4-ose reductase